MFKKILVALDHSKADSFLLPRVTELARLTGAEIVLLHVSTGWAAQWQENLNLSDSKEIREDREYLERVSEELRRENGIGLEEFHSSVFCEASREPLVARTAALTFPAIFDRLSRLTVLFAIWLSQKQ